MTVLMTVPHDDSDDGSDDDSHGGSDDGPMTVIDGPMTIRYVIRKHIHFIVLS